MSAAADGLFVQATGATQGTCLAIPDCAEMPETQLKPVIALISPLFPLCFFIPDYDAKCPNTIGGMQDAAF